MWWEIELDGIGNGLLGFGELKEIGGDRRGDRGEPER